MSNLTLQINTRGSWRTVVEFDARERDRVLAGTAALAGILGKQATWCLLHQGGKREWLPGIADGRQSRWQPVTDDAPLPLVDVMVSAVLMSGDEPLVYMAYRSSTDPRQFLLTGTSGEVLPADCVYAWASVLPPAPLAQQAAA